MLDTLEALADRDMDERVRRLERRDLEREEIVMQLNATIKRAEKVLWLGVGAVMLRVAQEGGLDVVRSLWVLVAG